MKKFISEFKEFAMKGNMLDLAVGVIVGGAFGTVVNSIVNDIFMPIIGVIVGGRDFSKLSISFGDSQIKYGLFIQNLVNFLVIAFCLFVVIKFINRLKKYGAKEEELKEEKTPEKPADIALLEEIRDSLAEIKNKE